MTEPNENADIVDHGASDVLAEDDVVQVPEGAADLAEASEPGGTETFITDVANWDADDETMPAGGTLAG